MRWLLIPLTADIGPATEGTVLSRWAAAVAGAHQIAMLCSRDGVVLAASTAAQALLEVDDLTGRPLAQWWIEDPGDRLAGAPVGTPLPLRVVTERAPGLTFVRLVVGGSRRIMAEAVCLPLLRTGEVVATALLLYELPGAAAPASR